MRVNSRDVAAGGLFIAFGAFFIVDSLTKLQLGTAFRMGPGYFPVLVGSLLALLGAVIALRAIGSDASPVGALAWRGLLMISAAIALFGLTVRGLGLAPALALTTMLSAYASRRMTLGVSLATTAALTAFCVLIFKVGLKQPLQLIGPWLGG